MSLSSSSTGGEPAAGFANFIASKLIVNGVVICITAFEYEEKTDKHDVTGTCSSGKRSWQAGVSGADFNGKGFLDLTASPFTEVPNRGKGGVVYSADGTNVNFSSTKCVFDSIKVTGSMQDGVISYTFSGSAGDDYVVA